MNGKIEVIGEVSNDGKLEEQVYGLPISVDNLEFQRGCRTLKICQLLKSHNAYSEGKTVDGAVQQ